MLSSARLQQRHRQMSIATVTPRRSRQRTISGNERCTPMRNRTQTKTLTVGVMIDGVYRELGVVNVPQEGATIVVQGPI